MVRLGKGRCLVSSGDVDTMLLRTNASPSCSPFRGHGGALVRTWHRDQDCVLETQLCYWHTHSRIISMSLFSKSFIKQNWPLEAVHSVCSYLLKKQTKPETLLEQDSESFENLLPPLFP